MEIMGVADNVSSEVKSLMEEFVKSGGSNSTAGLALMFQTYMGKAPQQNDIESLTELYSTIKSTNGASVKS